MHSFDTLSELGNVFNVRTVEKHCVPLTVARCVYFLSYNLKRIKFVKCFILNNIRDKYYALIGFNYIRYVEMKKNRITSILKYIRKKLGRVVVHGVDNTTFLFAFN